MFCAFTAIFDRASISSCWSQMNSSSLAQMWLAVECIPRVTLSRFRTEARLLEGGGRGGGGRSGERRVCYSRPTSS